MSHEAVPQFQPLEVMAKDAKLMKARTFRPTVTNFDFNTLFTVMTVVENGQVWSTVFEETPFTNKEKFAQLDAALGENGVLINKIIQSLGGIPVRLEDESTPGRITAVPGLQMGKWIAVFQPYDSNETNLIERSADEIQAEHIALLPPSSPQLEP